MAMEYVIEHDMDVTNLENTVRHRIALGWLPMGGVTVADGELLQVLIRVNPPAATPAGNASFVIGAAPFSDCDR